jgi:putative hydrolase of the HAD superfamily
MQSRKAIIFDLGGVILNIDYNKTSEAFKKAGVQNIDDMYSQKTADMLFRNLEEGKITEAAFFNSLRAVSGIALSDQQITEAWNSMLLDFRKETLDFITTLRPRYKVYLLSNTNSIHLREFYNIYKRLERDELFEELFDAVYYSHLIGYRKPDAAAYQYVLEKNLLKAEECVFVDDSFQNIEGARLAGLEAIFLAAGERVERLKYLSS